jgi:hypothetical protein
MYMAMDSGITLSGTGVPLGVQVPHKGAARNHETLSKTDIDL